MTQVILAFSNNSLSFTPDAVSDTSYITAILPTEKDEIRSYKWKNEDVTLKNYVETNGQYMIEMDKEIAESSLNEEQKRRLETLGKLPHPCCDAPINTKDCLHAKAAMGLAKYLITLGWNDEKIKKELFLWYRFWWPKHYALAASYLQLKETDPRSVSVEDWMSARLSTIKSEQLMIQELMKSN